jgi:uncharacterized protein
VGRPVVYFEIGCRDRAAGAAFSSSLFEWDVDGAGDSSAFTTNAGRGIDGHLAALGHEPHAYTIFYVEVDDLDATLARAAELGGATLLGPVAIPDGTFAWLSDPQGNTVGVIQPTSS